MAEKPTHAHADIFIDKRIVELAHNPAQLIGSSVISGLTDFFADKPVFERMTISIEVSNTQPRPKCLHDDVWFDRKSWMCNDCGITGER